MQVGVGGGARGRLQHLNECCEWRVNRIGFTDAATFIPPLPLFVKVTIFINCCEGHIWSMCTYTHCEMTALRWKILFLKLRTYVDETHTHTHTHTRLQPQLFRGITFHRPVVDGCLCYQGNSVEIDPLPEDDIIGHLVSLHPTLHFNVEDLEALAGWRGSKRNKRRK